MGTGINIESLESRENNIRSCCFEPPVYRDILHTYTTQVEKDIIPMTTPRYKDDQFLGFEGSSSPSQSTSKIGSAVAVVLTEAWRDNPDCKAVEPWGVRAFSGSLRWSSF